MKSFIIMAMVLFSWSCENKPLGTVSVTKDVSFTTHIKPITSTVCMSCHFEGVRDYSNYDNAYARRQLIYQKVVIEKTMPMGKTLTDEQRALFRDWYKQGSKQ